MVRTVCLNENNHAVTMLRGLNQMKQEDDFCDFTIKVESLEHRVHRNIIAVGSPYFKAMLKHDTKESQEGLVMLKDVDAECVDGCVNFLYSGKFDIPDGKICQFLHVAIMLQLENVRFAICNILDEELSPENFYDTRIVAEIYHLQAISVRCEAYYRKNFMAISSQPGFQTEGISHLVNIFKSKKFGLTEDEKITASLRWIGDDLKKKESLFKLLKHIKLKEISNSYLYDLVRNHPVISNDFRLYKIINDPLLEHHVKVTNDKKNHDAGLLVLFDCDADCIRSFNPTTGQVEKFHNEKFIHLRNFTAVSIDSYAYVLCGNKSVHRLNMKDGTSKWERMQDMISDHGKFPPSTSFSKSLFVIGSTGTTSSVVEMFNPLVNRWLTLADKPVAVESASLVSLDDSIYCIGGYEGYNLLNSFCKFTPSISKWIDLQPMNKGRAGCGVVAVEQKIFVMGGCEAKDIECYDVTLSQWTILSPLINLSWERIAAFHVDRWIYSVPCDGMSNLVEKYDIANNKWSKIDIIGDLGPFLVYYSFWTHF